MSWRNPGHVAHRDDTSQARGHRAAQAPCGAPWVPLGTPQLLSRGVGHLLIGACPSGSGLLLWALLSRVSLAVEEGPLAQTGGGMWVKWGSWHGHLHVEKCSKVEGLRGRVGTLVPFSSPLDLAQCSAANLAGGYGGLSHGVLVKMKRRKPTPERHRGEAQLLVSGTHPMGREARSVPRTRDRRGTGVGGQKRQPSGTS